MIKQKNIIKISHSNSSITPANEPIVKQIEALVDKILETKKQDKNIDTSAWEREIDKLVYKLYDLTEEEIKIIEGVKISREFANLACRLYTI